jgi:hypothetical protein
MRLKGEETVTRRLVIGSTCFAALAAAAALFVVAGGTAGTGSYDFVPFGVPTQLTAGQQGLVFARFSPKNGSGASTKTTIRFTFPATSLAAGTTPVADPATSSDCGAATGSDPVTITCVVGTVNPGQVVKRFVTFFAGTTVGDAGVTESVSFDSGSTSAKGGGHTDGPSLPAGLSVVDGTNADGTCASGGGAVHTAAVSTTVPQQTTLSFGDAVSSFQLPCSWGTVGVINQRSGPNGAPEISSVGGPQFSGPSTLQISFASLPVSLSKFVLKENKSFNPDDPTTGWSPVPPCPTATTLPANTDIDACLVGYTKGKIIVATLLYRGTNTDPWFN